MAFKASDLAWWTWLLTAAIAAFVSGLTFIVLMNESYSEVAKTFPILFPIVHENFLLSVMVILLAIIASASCTIIGIIRLVKWASEN